MASPYKSLRNRKRNVDIYHVSGKFLGCQVTRAQAMRMIERGEAHPIIPGAPFKGIVRGDQHNPLATRFQESAYEALGIEKYPIVVQGGLTRTETKPAPAKVYKPQTKEQRSATPPEQKEPLPQGFQL